MGEKQALRPYQEAARKSIHNEWENGRLRTLLVLPTGTGKTIVFASIAADQVRAGDRVLILAHRGELLEQAADKLQRSTGLVSAVEKAESTCLDSWYRVVVGSVQTLQRSARLERFPRDYFGTIIIDEAHHSITDGYRRILDYFDSAKLLGVTATPDRGDMRNLGEVFDSLAYEYKLTDAIKDGYLCRIMAQTIPLKLDISNDNDIKEAHMAIKSKARHDLTLRSIKREIAAGRDVAYWLDKAYTHLDSGLLTEDDIAEVEALAQAYYDALDAKDAADAEEITQ